MSNFLTPSQIAAASIAALDEQFVLAQTVTRFGEADFTGKVGDTVTVRVDALAGEARTYDTARSSAIVMDELNETGVNVALTNYVYKGANINDEDLTLSIVNFTKQVTTPLVKSVAAGVEKIVGTAISSVSNTVTASYSDLADGILTGEAELNASDVPMEDRFLAVGSNVRKALLKSDDLAKVDGFEGSNVLRSAIIGDLYGMTVVFSNRIPANAAVAYHSSAFALVEKALEVPAGATHGETVVFNGHAIRWIQDYDSTFQRDRGVASTLAGISPVLDGDDADEMLRAVRINFS